MKCGEREEPASVRGSASDSAIDRVSLKCLYRSGPPQSFCYYASRFAPVIIRPRVRSLSQRTQCLERHSSPLPVYVGSRNKRPIKCQQPL